MSSSPRKWPAHNQALRETHASAVRAWRELDADLTREELAAKLRISVRSVQRIENGECSIRADLVYEMERIATGLVKRLFPQDGHNLCESAGHASETKSR